VLYWRVMAPRTPNRGSEHFPPDPPDESTPPDLKQAIAALPSQPGVYLFRDREGKLLYVGKAKRLDQRVRSHFQDPAALGPRQVVLTRRAVKVEYITTDSEIDALILESTLVRERQPPFNVRLRDDKRYPYVRVSWQEPYPKVSIVRRIEKDGARYFGPYTEVKSLRQLLRMTQTIFPMRTCADIDAHIEARRECLEFHIGRCTGPCIGQQSPEEYRAMVDQFCDFLAGRRDEVVARLKVLQQDASERREYERAARLRDQTRRLESILARQRMVDVGGASADVLALARQGERACVVVFKIRERRVVARDLRWLRGAGKSSEPELLRAFVALYYNEAESIPETLVLEIEPAECELLEPYLSQYAEASVHLRQPRDATERALLRTARRNAAHLVSREREEDIRAIEGVAADEAVELQRALGLDQLPRRIRCFDVSQLFGTNVVASMVTFLDGRPFKSEYRRYRIRTVEGQDDFASIAEAVRRHAARVGGGEMAAADLLLIDGGVGQVSAAETALVDTPLATVPVAGLAKRLEEIVRLGLPPLRLSRRSPALKLLQRVRDEAHRFAIAYHRILRGRAARDSALESVPGLGPKRRALLLRKFGSVERLRQQPVDAIASLPGIGPRMAERILEAVGPATGGTP
jgi:excinuclease ABC subunit C